MSRPLSLDPRERIVACVFGRMSRRQAAERFGDKPRQRQQHQRADETACPRAPAVC